MSRDLMNHINPKVALAPVVVVDNTVQNCAIIDNAGYESLTYVVTTGVLADADATFTVTLTHGNDSALADGVAVATTDVIGTLALASFNFANDTQAFKLGYMGVMRYTRLTITPANNTGNAPLSVVAILGDAKVAPTPNPPV